MSAISDTGPSYTPMFVRGFPFSLSGHVTSATTAFMLKNKINIVIIDNLFINNIIICSSVNSRSYCIGKSNNVLMWRPRSGDVPLYISFIPLVDDPYPLLVLPNVDGGMARPVRPIAIPPVGTERGDDRSRLNVRSPLGSVRLSGSFPTYA